MATKHSYWPFWLLMTLTIAMFVLGLERGSPVMAVVALVANATTCMIYLNVHAGEWINDAIAKMKEEDERDAQNE